MIRGAAGVGKTSLLQHCGRQASGVRATQIAGLEAEMELSLRRRASALRPGDRAGRRTSGGRSARR
jgi:hypothetical protein